MSKDIKQAVREGYGTIARQSSSCCGTDSCCSSSVNPCCSGADMGEAVGKILGYSEDEMNSVPDGANLGLGCGNPIAIASLQKGETVLDLGSGGGFDCFLAANAVGEEGMVIGVDMTPEMLELARSNAEKGGYTNVEFRQGEIESLPVEDFSIDAIISNCVINLSPEKNKVFSEAFRVLKPGGRLMISDIVLTSDLPDEVRESVEAYISCIAGAEMKDTYIGKMKDAGFTDITIVSETPVPMEYESCSCGCSNGESDQAGTMTRLDAAVSVKISAMKPKR